MARFGAAVLLIAMASGCGGGPPVEERVNPPQEVSVAVSDMGLYPDLEAYVNARIGEFDRIPDDRKALLRSISGYVAGRVDASETARLTFICTHNSRRSHMSQIWAQAAAQVFGIGGVETYSGGTEATAFNPRAVAALRRAGFVIEPATDGDNPVYEVRFSEGIEPLQAFSKIYDQAPNPTEGFAAVMTCSSADAACPIVHGAAERIAIPFDDPKAFDDTQREAAAYDERCAQIAREMLFVFAEAAAG
jgi:arsenate reductase